MDLVDIVGVRCDRTQQQKMIIRDVSGFILLLMWQYSNFKPHKFIRRP